MAELGPKNAPDMMRLAQNERWYEVHQEIEKATPDELNDLLFVGAHLLTAVRVHLNAHRQKDN